jgi:uncharacterized protein involved in exopolysaccharide biosynthesis
MTTMQGRPAVPLQDDTLAGEVREISLWSYLNVLLRWRTLVVGLPVACAVATAAWVLLRPREFEARASFVSSDPPGLQNSFSQVATQLGLAPPRASATSPQFYVDLLQSREMMRRTLATEYQVPGEPAARSTLLQLLHAGGRDTTDRMLQGLDRLSRAMDVESDRVTGIVTFAVRTEQPALSVAVVNRFLELLHDFNLQRRQSQARAEREFVGQRLAEARDALRAAEESTSSFLQRNRDYTNSPVLRAAFARLQRDLQLRQELYLSLNQSFQSARIEEVRNTPVVTIIERPESLVEPTRRRLVRKTFAALVIGAVVAVGIAFLGEFVRNSARGDVPDYGQFVSLRREALRTWRSSRGQRQA